MEWKIGEIRQIDGEWYQCLEDTNNCCDCHDYCDLYKVVGYCQTACTSDERIDNNSVYFKKLEKVGEPYMVYGHIVRKYKFFHSPAIQIKGMSVLRTINSTNTIQIEIKQNKEDMGERNDIRPYDEYFSEGTVSNTKHLVTSNLKPFDIKSAKAGKPVCTRDGRKARIICFDRIDARPILALVPSTDGKGEDVFDYFVSGKRIANALESDLDLMMAQEEKVGWEE